VPLHALLVDDRLWADRVLDVAWALDRLVTASRVRYESGARYAYRPAPLTRPRPGCHHTV
jgi:hypothetical protein